MNSIRRAGELVLCLHQDIEISVQGFSQNFIDFVVQENGVNKWRGTGVHGDQKPITNTIHGVFSKILSRYLHFHGCALEILMK